MKIFSKQYEWLRLIDVSGPFLSATALDVAFPSGLDALDKRIKRELAHYYDEWQTAQDRHAADLPALHTAWCDAVLRRGLGYREKYLLPGDGWSVNGEGGIGVFSPDRALKIFGDKVDLFVKILPPGVLPHGRDTSDEWKDTFVEKMTRLCRSCGTRLGLVTNGEQWVLVNATQGGALSGSATWYARLWFQEDSTLRAFFALLGFDRFTGAQDKTLPRLLDESLEHLDEVTDTLGKQVMTAVEVLLEGLDRADLDSGRTLLRDVSPETLYEASLTVMMRLVFILCAEERGLLLLGEPAYDDAYAVSTLRGRLESDRDKFGDQVLERRYDAWVRLLGLFRAIYSGIAHPLLRMPAMGGSLFDPDKYPFLEGRSRDVSWDVENPPPLPIDNRTVLLLLESLQVLKAKDGAIPLSFRSLDVEQIGYVYEGLLETTGAQAEETLLGLKGDKDHHNPEIALSELEMLKTEGEEKLFARMKEVTGRSAIASEYAEPPDMTTLPFLGKACRGDEDLKSRILPFFNWMRTSEWGEPVVYHKDSFYVTEGSDRRSTGTHYTPKPLTVMMVKEALEPVVYRGPAEGLPRAEWKLKSPAEILDLKVCDPAMGSGAFLVQACRYLGDRLVDAWEQSEKVGVGREREVGVGSENDECNTALPASHSHSNSRAIDSQGRVVDFPPDEPMSKVQEDSLVEARRLVAEKCLYGVDINPLAVELAKLSLWLVTISKGRPFGFLDHNLKSGDSLLGISDVEQLVQFRMKPVSSDPGNLMSAQIRDAVEDAKKERIELRETRIRDIRDIRVQMQHLEKAEAATFRLKEYADYFIGTVLTSGKPTKKTFKEWDAAAMQGYSLLNPSTDSFASAQEKKRAIVMLSHDLPAGKTQARRPFHWAIEFPEVFAQGGFDCVVGNPPYINTVTLSSENNKSAQKEFYQVWYKSAKGSFDIYVPFYERSIAITKPNGLIGLLIPNKVLSIDYAEALRGLILDIGSIKTILDFSKGRYFQASVYPIALISIKGVTIDAVVRTPQSECGIEVARQLLEAVPDHLWGFVLAGETDLFVRLLTNTVPLDTVATVSATATVSEAYEISPLIEENTLLNQTIPKGYVKLIVSGNIRSGYATWGSDSVQYLKHSYKEPIIKVSRLPEKRARQAILPKIAISGLAPRPTAFFDEQGAYYPGKSTVIITAKSPLLLRNLTKLLNSRIGRIIYFAQYCSLSLQGGYMRFGPPQLNRFPVPAGFESVSQDITDAELCKLYGVTEEEIIDADKRLDEPDSNEVRNHLARINNERREEEGKAGLHKKKGGK